MKRVIKKQLKRLNPKSETAEDLKRIADYHKRAWAIILKALGLDKV